MSGSLLMQIGDRGLLWDLALKNDLSAIPMGGWVDCAGGWVDRTAGTTNLIPTDIPDWFLESTGSS